MTFTANLKNVNDNMSNLGYVTSHNFSLETEEVTKFGHYPANKKTSFDSCFHCNPLVLKGAV